MYVGRYVHGRKIYNSPPPPPPPPTGSWIRLWTIYARLHVYKLTGTKIPPSETGGPMYALYMYTIVV